MHEDVSLIVLAGDEAADSGVLCRLLIRIYLQWSSGEVPRQQTGFDTGENGEIICESREEKHDELIRTVVPDGPMCF